MIAEKSEVVERAISMAMSQSEEFSVLLERAEADIDQQSAAELRKEIAHRKQQQEVLRGLLERNAESSLDGPARCVEIDSPS